MERSCRSSSLLFFPLIALLLSVAFTACRTRSGHFKMEGRFLQLNQGEFYVYSTDGLIDGIDTVKIDGGRFAYEIACRHAGVLMLVFPNFSEQPVFAEPGEAVTIKADASHLKEMQVEGTEANKQMTGFRRQIANMSPPDARRQAEQFIRDNSASPVCAYILNKYFIQDVKPDYQKASELVNILIQKQPKNGTLNRMKEDIDMLKQAPVGAKLPPFSATDVNGKPITSSLFSGKVGIIYVWSTWNFQSHDVQRRIKNIREDHAGKLAVVGISLDASRRECKNFLKRDSLPWPVVCDEQMFDSPLLAKLGAHSVPENIIVDASGRIVARSLSVNEMAEKLKEMLK